MKYFKKINFYSLLFLIFFTYLWHRAGIKNPFITPGPFKTAKAFYSLLNDMETWKNIYYSIIRLYTAIFFALIFGCTMGITIFFNKKLGFFFKRLIYSFQFISASVLSILIIVILGLNPLAPLLIICIAILPNIFVSVSMGMEELKKEYIELGMVYTEKKYYFLDIL